MNAHPEYEKKRHTYVIANMRSAFATRGKTDVELAWWHANKFPVHRFLRILLEFFIIKSSSF